MARAIRGVPVLYVHPELPAHRAGLRRGDLIIAVNDVPTPDVDVYLEEAVPPFTATVLRGARVLELRVER